MKKIFVVLLSVPCFMACKKNSTAVDIAPAPAVAKVKTAAYGSNVATYTYDDQGRQLKVVLSDGGRAEYEYLPGVINRKFYGPSSTYLYTMKFELNSDGLCIRETVSSDPVYESLLKYNTDKSIAQNIVHNSLQTTQMDYFYSNGKCDSVRSTSAGKWLSTAIETYYTNKPNVLSGINTGESFLGKPDAYMLKSQLQLPGNTLLEFSYEYDAQGRVTKRSTAAAGGYTTDGFYTYY